MPGSYLERPPITLLADALALSEMAADYPVAWQDSHATLSRSAILTAILALEATANTLLSTIEFPERLMALVDQAPVTEKFEFALYARDSQKTLDRGVRHTQVLRELFEIRNRFVHPKVAEHTISHRNLDSDTFQIEKTTAPSQYLRVPASAEDWRVEHVRAVIKAVFEFLDHFLLDLCNWPEETLAQILLSRVTIDTQVKRIRPQPQARVFLRAGRRGLRSKAIWSALRLDDKTLEKPTRFTIKYSWTRGPVQALDQKYSFDIFDAPRLYDGMTAAVYKFLNWFATAQRHLNGRDLAEFEVFNGDGSERLAAYRSFIPIGQDEPGREAARHVGVVPEAKLHFFANGFSSVVARSSYLLRVPGAVGL